MSDAGVRRVTDVNARIRAEHHEWGMETFIRSDEKEDYALIPWDLWERLVRALKSPNAWDSVQALVEIGVKDE